MVPGQRDAHDGCRASGDTYNSHTLGESPAVPAEWVEEFEDSDAARELERRLTADVELLADLALVGYAGPDWEAFRDVLARYGFPVIESWLRTEAIFGMLRAKSLGGVRRPPERARWKQDAPSIAGETVAEALVLFREQVLLKHRWSARGGASLKTYFIGMCLMAFRNVWRRWLAQTFGRDYVMTSSDSIEVLSDRPDMSALGNPEQVALSSATFDTMVSSGATREQQAVLLLTAHRFRQAEIAASLGVSEKAVEMMLYRVRAAWKREAG